ncbi:MAG TPA: DegQ family serine endoprotease [Vicinamibacterales bacterium]|nr:DegQ family serine endoprotease [Vicinamibacterales bacterium]
MHNRYVKKGGLAAVGLAFVALVAWKAPEPNSHAAATKAVATAAAPASTASPAAPAASYASVVDRVMPAVVTVRVEKRAAAIPTDQQMPDEMLRRFFGPQMRMPRQPRGVERGLGSGVIVSQDGYILTNNHVVDGADEVQVELPDKRTFTAKVVGTDPPSDLAVVKIDAKALPTLTLGNSDAVKVGDVVLAVGDPLGIGETVTSGIISAKGRQTEAGDAYQDFLQTDAAINHGNSGGALVNTSGELIGINSQILSPSDGNIGLGFAIPSNMAKHVMAQLIDHGSVRRGKLGVTVQPLSADMAKAFGLSSADGALVSDVDPGSPAAHAGIEQGDVITRFNGAPVTDSNQLRNDVASTQPGTTVSLQVVRHGQSKDVQATLAALSTTPEQTGDEGGENGRGTYGMSVQPFTPDMADQLGVPRSTQGLVVAGVDPAGAAADSQIQEGDVIEQVNGQAVKTADGLRSALDTATAAKPALLLINRKGTDLFLTIHPR